MEKSNEGSVNRGNFDVQLSMFFNFLFSLVLILFMCLWFH